MGLCAWTAEGKIVSIVFRTNEKGKGHWLFALAVDGGIVKFFAHDKETWPVLENLKLDDLVVCSGVIKPQPASDSGSRPYFLSPNKVSRILL